MSIREGALGYHRLRDGDVCAVCLKSTPCEVEQALDLHAARAEISVIDATTQRARAIDAEAKLARHQAEQDAARDALQRCGISWGRCMEERDAAMDDAAALAEALRDVSHMRDPNYEYEWEVCPGCDAPWQSRLDGNKFIEVIKHESDCVLHVALAAHEKLVAK